MSEINDLIKRYCFDGVEYCALGSVAAYSDTRVDANTVDGTTFVGVDNLLPNKAGRVDATYSPNSSRLTAYRSGDVLLGNIRPYLKKVWLATNSGGCSGDVLAVRILPTYAKRLIPQFLYYALSSDAFFAFNMQHAKGAKMPRGDKGAILKFRIPLPPLEVQQEVANILEKFTSLETELTTKLGAELKARKKQYEFYRNQLLSFDDSKKIEWTTLNHIAVNLDSKRKPVTKGMRTAGDIPYYGASGIVDYVSDYIFDEDLLLVSEDGANLLARSTPIAFSVSGKTWVNNHAHVLKFDTYAARRVVEIYLNSIDLTPYISGGAQPKLNKANLNKIKIPLPPVEEQSRIVGILDKFEMLVSGITKDLPSEINARREQYEYYRNKLLTFKELPA